MKPERVGRPLNASLYDVHGEPPVKLFIQHAGIRERPHTGPDITGLRSGERRQAARPRGRDVLLLAWTSVCPLKVSFNVSVEARSCPPPGAARRRSFTIKPVGFKDRLEVAVDYRCDCGCSREAQSNSSICSATGTYDCGTCHCEPGYLGARCECQEGGASSSYRSACREAEGKRLCSGRGECSCNQCLCYESEFGKIYGGYCECDDFSCARHKGVLCSGRPPVGHCKPRP
ncbi:Integrin beta-5 [Liparis tanakae]|uniref:Integrin beta-5 n=1 Tax=Liparis tanakae TaxID=230148 RepID=A0A4Z2EJB9_9TELE|nr:Integrin beta-5 [Liparis tanakae]